MTNKIEMELSIEHKNDLIGIIMARFEKNISRHKSLNWNDIAARLESQKQKLWSINQMEITGGEPDVVWQDALTGEYVFIDCSKESPSGRRSLCYDNESWESRRDNKPSGSALHIAEAMGIELLTEEQYFELQKLGPFDTKTSSWLKTPMEIRKLGGAIFGDFRYGRTFIYHNGAESYYTARGFRGMLKI